jgi:hypothetical protein
MSVDPKYLLRYSVEQEVSLANCHCAPGQALSCLQENNQYYIKEDGHQVGSIREDCECICRTCIPAQARSAKNIITFNNQEYVTYKEFRLGYACKGLHTHRPDVIVQRNGATIGTIEMPLCPNACHKMQVNCYRGDGRTPADLLWTISKCAINCHTCCGKLFGGCTDCAGYMSFEVSGAQKVQGALVKAYFGLFNECSTLADKYLFEFPTVNDDEKAVYLAAIYFIDLLWFENNYNGGGGI